MNAGPMIFEALLVPVRTAMRLEEARARDPDRMELGREVVGGAETRRALNPLKNEPRALMVESSVEWACSPARGLCGCDLV